MSTIGHADTRTAPLSAPEDTPSTLPVASLGPLFDAIGEGVTIQSPSGAVVYANAAALRALGFPTLQDLASTPPAELVERFDIMDETGRPVAIADLPGRHALQGIDAPERTLRFRIRATGQERWSVVRAMPFRDAAGRILGAVNHFRDVTKEKLQAAAIEKERNLLSTIIQQLPAGVLVAEAPSGRMILANDRVDAILGHGFTPAQGLEQYAQYVALRPDGEPLRAEEYPLLRALIHGEVVQGEELTFRRNGGGLVPLLVNAGPVRDAQGAIIAAVVAFADLTEVKRAESEVRESRERLDIALTAAELGAWDLDLRSDRAVRSQRHDQIFGYPQGAAEWSSEVFYAHVLPGHREAVKARFEQALRDGRLQFECEIRRADGALAWISAQGRVVHRDGRPIRMLGIVADISFRKRAEQEIREKEERLRAALDASATGTIRWDVATDALEWDDNLDRLFGLPPGRTAHHIEQFTDLVHPDDRAAVGAALARCVQQGADLDIEFRVVWPDGTLRWLLDRGSMIRDAAGRAVYMAGACTDVTLRKRGEDELRQRADELARVAEALERSNRELDQFAYVTSHDLKAPLRGIANLSRWIEEDLGDHVSAEARGHLDMLRGRVNRMDALIDAILEYSRVGRKRGRIEPVPARRLVDEIVDLLAPPQGFVVRAAEDLPVVITERAQLQQVLINLIGNAVKHHPAKERGVVTVGVEDAGAFWRFSVSDNGRGIPRRFHEKVFAIFQTLEARDKIEGTGIGLAIVKKVVESKGGRVELVSDDGQGATFRFTWPKSESGGETG